MLKILLPFFALVIAADGQDVNNGLTRDTSATRISIDQPEQQSLRTDILSPFSFDILYGNHLDLFLRSQDFGSESRSWLLGNKTDILSPWRLELKAEEKYSILRSILGSVEVGGTGYLAYRYLKKYGFK